jgi:hypothetical protein
MAIIEAEGSLTALSFDCALRVRHNWGERVSGSVGRRTKFLDQASWV